MIYGADLKRLSAKVGKKSSISHNSLLYDFSLGVCLWLNPSWKWGISVWPELSGTKGSISWVLLCENAFILRNHCALGLYYWDGVYWSICWFFFSIKVFVLCKVHAHTLLLYIWCQKINLARCSMCFGLHGYSQSDHK